VKISQNKQLARYVVFYYRQFLTQKEVLAWNHLIAIEKAASYRRKTPLPEEAIDFLFSESISTDPEVLTLASGGWEEFLEQTSARILSEHGADVYLNRCPKCGELTVTPRAKQCRYCFHDCHD